MAIRTLSATDAAWLIVESRDMPMHVGLLMEFSPPADAPADFLQQWRRREREPVAIPPPWNLTPVTARLAGVVPLLRETSDIDLDHHVRWWGLPRPGGQLELGVLVSHLHSQQLDLRRPLWEMHIIEGLADGRFAVFLKVHHSVIDGASAMQVITKAMSDSPDDRDMPDLFTVPAGSGARPPSGPPADLAAAARRGATAVRGLGMAGAGIVRAAVENGPLPLPFRHPSTPLATSITGQRRLATQQYDLALVMRLAKAADATVNDIVLHLSGTALRTYLGRYGQVPEQPMVASIPVNLRAAGDTRIGTVVGLMLAELGTNVADPLERLDAIKRSTAAAKEHLLPLPADAAIAYTGAMTVPYIAGLLTGVGGLAHAPQSLGISNVPGPKAPLYWNGARLDAIYPMSLVFHGNALNITCISYAGMLSVGFTGARDSLPHLQHIATGMGDALAELTVVLLPDEAPLRRGRAPGTVGASGPATA